MAEIDRITKRNDRRENRVDRRTDRADRINDRLAANSIDGSGDMLTELFSMGDGDISNLLMNMVGNTNPDVAKDIDDYRTDPGKALRREADRTSIYGGGMKGAVEGAATAGLPGLITGFVGGMVSAGGRKGDLEDQAAQESQDWSQYWGGRSAQESASKGYASGGKIKGKGTGKSDSIGIKASEGDFIVPEGDSAKIGMEWGMDYLGWDDGEVAKKNDGNINANVSNGELKYTKDEYDTLISYGLPVDDLAPDAEKNKTGFSRGGKMKKASGGPIFENNDGPRKKADDKLTYTYDKQAFDPEKMFNESLYGQTLKREFGEMTPEEKSTFDKERRDGATIQTISPKDPDSTKSEFWNKFLNNAGTIAGLAQTVGGAYGLAKAGRRPDINVSKSLERLSRDTREAAGYGLPSAVKNEMKKKNAQAFRSATNQITSKGGSPQEIHNKTISALSAMLSEHGKTELTDYQEKERKVGVNIGVEKMKAGQEFDIDKIGLDLWKEDQDVWANLLATGVENTIGANQYKKQLEIMKEIEKSKAMQITFANQNQS